MCGFAEHVDAVVGFLEVAVHCVLFAREVYPAAVFDRMREYGMAVWRCRHPGVCHAVHEMLSGVRELLYAGAVRSVSVVLLGASGEAIEQVVFEVDTLGLAADRESPSKEDLNEMFASTLLKLVASESILGPTSDKVELFDILIEADRDHPASKATYHSITPTTSSTTTTTTTTTPSSSSSAASGGGVGGLGTGYAEGMSRGEALEVKRATERETKWAHVHRDDPEAALIVPARMGHDTEHMRRVAIKSIHTGVFRLAVSALKKEPEFDPS